MRIRTLKISGWFVPVFAVGVPVVDNQGIAFPTANGFGMPELDRFRKAGAAIGRNDPIVMHLFVEDHDVADRLDDLQSVVGESVARRWRWSTVPFWIVEWPFPQFVPFRQCPGLIWNFPFRRIHNHAAGCRR